MDYLQEIHRTHGLLFDLVSLIGAMFGALIAMVSAVISARQLSAARNTHNFQYVLAARQNALRYSISNNWENRNARTEIEKAFQGIDNRQEPVTLEEVVQAKQQFPLIEESLRTLLGNFENLALAIQAGVADDDVAFQLLGAPFLKTAEIFKPFMEERRTVHPSRYLNLFELKTRWEKRDPSGMKFGVVYFGRNPSLKNRRIR